MQRLFLLSLAVGLIGTGCGGPTATEQVFGTRERKKEQVAALYKSAPDFALKDFLDQTVRLSDHRGKYVVLNFWASWCAECVNEMPDLGKLQEAHKGRITVIAVNRAEPAEVAKNFADRVEVRGKYILLLDPKDSAYESFGDGMMPLTVFIGTEGEIRAVERGPMDLKKLQARVKAAFSL